MGSMASRRPSGPLGTATQISAERAGIVADVRSSGRRVAVLVNGLGATPKKSLHPS